jgi:hypothetical protein
MILNHIQYRIKNSFSSFIRSFIVHIKMSSASSSYSSSSSSSPTAPHVSPTLKHKSWYPTSEKDLELEFELRKREMKKIQEARMRMISGAGAGAEKNKRSSRADACDLDGDEFKIVCEELWIDFRRWVNHHENVSDCMDTVRAAFVSYWAPFCLTLGFLMWFRWYIGAGKDACSHGVGYGVFSFACEVLRHLGEIVGAFILMIIGFCVGMVPMLVCVCFYEFNDAFPDPEGDGDDDEDSEHVKKE